MSEKEKIQELNEEIEKLKEFRIGLEKEREIEERVRTIVRVRCAAAYASILGFMSLFVGIISFYSDTAKEASKAAIKIIITRIWQ